jgi:hypothetical protein
MNAVLKILAIFGVGTALAVCPSCSTNAGAESAPTQTTPASPSVTLTIEG